jgi:hypothetical protein
VTNALVDYLTLACTGTGQATFYNAAEDQERALEAAHAELLRSDRRVYGLTAALPINDRSRQLVLRNLLGSGKGCTDSRLEGQIVGMVAGELPFNRVLNLLGELRERKVNNARTRGLGRRVWGQVDAYRAIKYRDKVRAVLRHCHIPEGDDPARAELHRWVFGKLSRADEVAHNPKLASRLRAGSDYRALFDLPFDIARDIAVASHGKKPDEFEREFTAAGTAEAGTPRAAVTRKESLRARAHTGDTAVDFRRFSLQELLLHAHRNPHDGPAVLGVVREKARELAGGIALPARTALVVDNSLSALGPAERRYHPLALIEAIVQVLTQAGQEVSCHYVGPAPHDGFLVAEGATDLRRPLVEALLTRPELVVILSDGYENIRAGGVNQVLGTRAFRSSGVAVLHLNPVPAAESGGVRSLTVGPMTFALTAIEQLPVIALIGLAARDPRALEPLFGEVERAIREGDFRRARLATRRPGLPALAG